MRDMSKPAKNKLRQLAEQKAITCAKIDLLQCLSVEFEKQNTMWKKFNENCQGDYLASFTSEMVKDLTCGKNVCFSGQDLHTMKAVAQCFNISQNLCKGHKDGLARFHDRDAIDDEYTLGHICYSELQNNVRKFGDEWSKAAYRNRIPDPVPSKVMICENPETGQTNMVSIPQAPVQPPPPLVPVPQPTIMPMGGSGAPGMPGPPGPAGQTILPPAPPGPSTRQLIDTGKDSGLGQFIDTGKVDPRDDQVFGSFDATKDKPDPVVIDDTKDKDPIKVKPEPSSALDCDGLLRYLTAAYQGQRIPRDVTAKYSAMVSRFMKVYADKIDPEFGRFIRNALNKSYFKRFSPSKMAFLKKILFGYCAGATFIPPLAPGDGCDRIEYYLGRIKDQWLTKAEWEQLIGEVQDVSRAKGGHPESERMKAYFQRIYQQGGVDNVQEYMNVAREVLKWCREVDQPPSAQLDTPGDECINFILKMYSIKSSGIDSVPRSERKAMTQQIDKWTPFMDSKRRNLIPQLVKDLFSGEQTLTRKSFTWLTWNLYAICKGRRLQGFRGDECDKLDFYILTAQHTGYLDPESEEDFRKMMPPVMERASQETATELNDLYGSWRLSLLTQAPMSPQEWGRFRWLVQDACKRDPRVAPQQDNRDFCTQMMDRMIFVYTDHATSQETALVDNEVNAFIDQFPEQKQMWLGVWEKMKAHDSSLDRGLINKFQQHVYMVCVGAKASQGHCAKVDFLLLQTGVSGGLTSPGWEYLRSSIPPLIQKSITQEDFTFATEKWKHLANFGKIAHEDLGKLRTIIYGNCIRDGGGRQIEDDNPPPPPGRDDDFPPPPPPGRDDWPVRHPIKIPAGVRVPKVVSPVAGDIVPWLGVPTPDPMPNPWGNRQWEQVRSFDPTPLPEFDSPPESPKRPGLVPPVPSGHPPIPIRNFIQPELEDVDVALLNKVIGDLKIEYATGVPAVLPPEWTTAKVEAAQTMANLHASAVGQVQAQLAHRAAIAAAHQAAQAQQVQQPVANLNAIIAAQAAQQVAQRPPRRPSATTFNFGDLHAAVTNTAPPVPAAGQPQWAAPTPTAIGQPPAAPFDSSPYRAALMPPSKAIGGGEVRAWADQLMRDAIQDATMDPRQPAQRIGDWVDAPALPYQGRVGVGANQPGLLPSFNIGQGVQQATFDVNLMGQAQKSAGLAAIADNLMSAGRAGGQALHALQQNNARAAQAKLAQGIALAGATVAQTISGVPTTAALPAPTVGGQAYVPPKSVGRAAMAAGATAQDITTAAQKQGYDVFQQKRFAGLRGEVDPSAPPPIPTGQQRFFDTGGRTVAGTAAIAPTPALAPALGAALGVDPDPLGAALSSLQQAQTGGTPGAFGKKFPAVSIGEGPALSTFQQSALGINPASAAVALPVSPLLSAQPISPRTAAELQAEGTALPGFTAGQQPEDPRTVARNQLTPLEISDLDRISGGELSFEALWNELVGIGATAQDAHTRATLMFKAAGRPPPAQIGDLTAMQQALLAKQASILQRVGPIASGPPLVPTNPAFQGIAGINQQSAAAELASRNYAAALQRAETGQAPLAHIKVPVPMPISAPRQPATAADIAALLGLGRGAHQGHLTGQPRPSRIVGLSDELPLSTPNIGQKRPIEVTISGAQDQQVAGDEDEKQETAGEKKGKDKDKPEPGWLPLNADPCIAIIQIVQALMRDPGNRLYQKQMLHLMKKVGDMTLGTAGGTKMTELHGNLMRRGVGGSHTTMTDAQLKKVFDAAWDACKNLEEQGTALKGRSEAETKQMRRQYISSGMALKATFDKEADRDTGKPDAPISDPRKGVYVPERHTKPKHFLPGGGGTRTDNVRNRTQPCYRQHCFERHH